MNKRGMSTVIISILLVMLALAAIGVISLVIKNILSESTENTSLGKYTIRLKISSVKVEAQTIDVKVKREPGVANLSGIRFVVYDGRSSELFDRNTTLKELEENTFVLTYFGSAARISIAPILFSEKSGKEYIGEILDTYIIKEISEEDEGEGGEETVECLINSDCGIDVWIPEGTSCEGNDIWKFKKIYSCDNGICRNENIWTWNQSCGEGFVCSNGQCIIEKRECSLETLVRDCGLDDFTGLKICSSEGDFLIQDFKIYSCEVGKCVSTIESRVVENCSEQEKICWQGECLSEIMCTSNQDCFSLYGDGFVCLNSSCVQEEAVNSGIVLSIWPFGVAEYFDSPDLNVLTNGDYVNYYVKFTSGNENRCLQIAEYIYPLDPLIYNSSYIRLNVFESQVRGGDAYEIWQTSFGCSS